MIEKIRTAAWFAKRPSHWEHAAALTRRKFLPNHDAPSLRAQAQAWAAEQAVTVPEALSRIGIEGDFHGMDAELIMEGKELAAKSAVEMGGPGDLDLLSDAVRLTGAIRVVETGVAYGWSSLAILDAMETSGSGQLISVDMPYPKMGNEDFVGVVVPERLRGNWTLIRQPDRPGLEKAIEAIGGRIDLCHYDSDKSWWGRAYAFPILWEALVSDGVFISDDIQDNMFFAEFARSKAIPFAVTSAGGKFVGLIRKA
ncbi:MAG: Methyltransferase domain [Halomonas sp. HL-93]|nr:MAG: Methyltransferase domain [Halomonas sp. HL-93]